MDEVRWNNIDCRSGHPDLYTLTGAQMMDLGKDWLSEILTELNKDDVRE